MIWPVARHRRDEEVPLRMSQHPRRVSPPAVHDAFHGELRLVAAEAAHAPLVDWLV